MGKSGDVPVLIIRLAWATSAVCLDRRRFLYGSPASPPVCLYVCVELSYTLTRVYYAWVKYDGSQFLPSERQETVDMPKWWKLMALFSFLANFIGNTLWFAAPETVEFAAMPRAWMPEITEFGAALGVMGIGLQILSHAHLGDSWSTKVETKREQRLVTAGVYSRVRHPMYTSFLLNAASVLLLTANWLVGLSALAFVLLAVWRIPLEEEMMIAQFGQAYIDYRARTGMLLPALGAKARASSEGTDGYMRVS